MLPRDPISSISTVLTYSYMAKDSMGNQPFSSHIFAVAGNQTKIYSEDSGRSPVLIIDNVSHLALENLLPPEELQGEAKDFLNT